MRSARPWIQRHQRGQAQVEYASLTLIISLALLGATVGQPVMQALFQALQTYIDYFLYCLNLAIG
jgi:Flp pilus assembly pilin Flp